MVFKVLSFNRDDHTKQIAFLMNKSGEWRLSPAYDAAYAYNPSGEFTSTHQMTVNRKRKDIIDDDFLAVAKRQGLNNSSATHLIKNVKAAVANWYHFAKEANVDTRKSHLAGNLIAPNGTMPSTASHIK